jgi:NAD(P)-dependent dehydrogenase (short-subunit alcohol dehydrogenase family)
MPNALVTGADRGFGLSISKELLNLGWTVYAGKFIEEYTLLEDLQKENGRLRIVMLDVGSKETIQAAFEEVSRETDTLDMLISNAALMGRTGKDIPEKKVMPHYALPEGAKTDYEHVWRSFKVNALGALTLTNVFLPMIERGGLKRLCYVSSEVASISMMNRDRAFAYPMSKSSLNMTVRMIHNGLFPKGCTVRLFHPGWMRRVMLDGTRVEGAAIDPDEAAEFAVKYFTEPLNDEHRLVMVDYLGHEWPY